MLPLGIRNNNPGNIDKGSAWQGEVLSAPGRFCTFLNIAYGYRALALVLLHYYNHEKLNTVEQIISRWAPNVENNTSAYVKDVAEECGVMSTQPIKLDPVFLPLLVRAIAHHENGEGPWLNSAGLKLGVSNALGINPLSKVAEFET